MYRRTLSGCLLAVFILLLGSECYDNYFDAELSSRKSHTLRTILSSAEPSGETVQAADDPKREASRIAFNQPASGHDSLPQSISLRRLVEQTWPPRKTPEIFELTRVFLL
jgi:hypothetical protein